MTPLASWLDMPWRHEKGDGYGDLVRAAKRLDERVWREHGITLMFCSDPWWFRTINEKECARDAVHWEIDTREPPQLGKHADPICCALDADTFYALIGTAPDRPAPLYTLNSARKFPQTDDDPSIADRFLSRRLWSDHPERDCAGLSVGIQEEIPGGLLWSPLPAVYTGTAWTREDRRRRKIMTDVSRLHRLVAFLRFGSLPQFATVVPKSGAEKVFGGTDIGCVIEHRGKLSTEVRVLFWSPEDLKADAESVLTEPTP